MTDGGSFLSKWEGVIKTMPKSTSATSPDPSPAAPVDTSAEAVAALVERWRYKSERARSDAARFPDSANVLEGFAQSVDADIATLAAVVKERDAARAEWGKNEADAEFWKHNHDTASRQLAEARALLDGRDKFIVDRGLWMDFVGTLPKARQP